MSKKVYILTALVMLCCFALCACGGASSASGAAASETLTKEDFRPEFLKGENTAEVGFDPKSSTAPGIPFLIEHEGYEIELNVSAGTIWDGRSADNGKGQDYKFLSGAASKIYWIPGTEDSQEGLAPMAEIKYTVYKDGKAAVEGVIEMLRKGDSYEYAAIMAKLSGV